MGEGSCLHHGAEEEREERWGMEWQEGDRQTEREIGWEEEGYDDKIRLSKACSSEVLLPNRLYLQRVHSAMSSYMVNPQMKLALL